MPLRFDPALLRLNAARALAWALLLAGWVGLGSLAMALTAGPLAGFAAIALWLLALGVFSAAIVKLPLDGAALRGLLAGAALLAAWGALGSVQGGGLPLLAAALAGWAMLVALASATVRSCRHPLARRPAPPLAPAAAGALLAWALLGDITNLAALGPRLAIGVLIAAALLAVLQPRRGADAGCRAGLFDCSLPAWPGGGWRDPQRVPILIATLAMLPMMCSLPLTVALCRGAAVSASTVVAIHFAAMFVPALALAPRLRRSGFLPIACAALLGLGALAAVLLPGAWAWWGLALTHGAAWSLAWVAQLDDRSPRAARPASPLPAAVVNAAFVLLLGGLVASAGLQAMAMLHGLIGAAGAAAGAWWLARSVHVAPAR